MKLLLDTCALLWMGLDASKLSERAQDVLAQNGAELFVSAISAFEIDVSWKAIAGKTAIDRTQVDRASLLGTELLVALGAKDHVANRATPETLDTRNRAFTLLVRAYDSARHALAYLRWHEGDVDQVAPSLYQRPRRRAAPAAAPVDSQPTDDDDEDAATPSSGLAPTGTE